MAFFQPVLRIQPSADLKSYTLEATVLVPSGCYVANGVSPGWPDKVGGIPEAEPVQLLIGRRKGPCIEAVQALTFVKKRIPLTGGKTHIVAHVMLENDAGEATIAGVGSIAIPRREDLARFEFTSAGASGAWIGPSEISAWIDRMPGPGSSPTLHIRVGMWAPTLGYRYQLTAIGPFGFTGLTLLCEMKATRPTGITLPLITHTIVSHDGPLGPKTFTSVAVAFEDSLQIGAIVNVS
jgi:hypothetical protein